MKKVLSFLLLAALLAALLPAFCPGAGGVAGCLFL